MSNDTMVTVQGWLGSEPMVRAVNGTPVANFRVGCTPRRYSRQRDEWVEGQTQWYNVSAWRTLGEHCGRSLKKGDPVLLHGRLTTRPWVNRAGVEIVSLEIEAISVGHDLSRGVSVFSKTTGGYRSERPAATAPASSGAAVPPMHVPEDPWRQLPASSHGPADDPETRLETGADAVPGGAGDSLLGEAPEDTAAEGEVSAA